MGSDFPDLDIFPGTIGILKNDNAVEYYEAYKNIGRKWTSVPNGKGSNARVILETGFDAMPSGGKYFIKDGDYPIDENINNVPSNTVIDAESWNARLYLAASRPEVYNNRIIFLLNAVHDVEIRNLCVDGNFLNSTIWKASSYAPIKVTGASYDLVFDNLKVIDAMLWGISVHAAGGAAIRDVHTRNCLFDRGGLWNSIYYHTSDTGTVTGGSIIGNDVRDFCDIGICLGTGSTGIVGNVTVALNMVHDGNVDGYGSGGGTDGIFGIRLEGYIYEANISNNQLWNVRRGLSTGPSNFRCTFVENKVKCNLTAGASNTAEVPLSVWGVKHKILGNYLIGGWSTINNIGIQVYASSTDIELSDNTIENSDVSASSFTGLSIAAGATRVRYHGNTFFTCDTDVADSGTNTRKRDNVGSDGNWMAEDA